MLAAPRWGAGALPQYCELVGWWPHQPETNLCENGPEGPVFPFMAVLSVRGVKTKNDRGPEYSGPLGILEPFRLYSASSRLACLLCVNGSTFALPS